MAVETYDQILSKLNDAPTLVRRPFSPQEIESIERDVGVKAPDGARAWLAKVGLFEDVSQVDASDFELHDSPESLVSSRRFIRDLLGDAGADLFPFGHDGAGDEIAVRSGPDGQDALIFVDHATRSMRVVGPLREWMSSVVDEAVQRAAEEGDGEEKFWCVQFTFKTLDEKPILIAVETIAPVRIPDGAGAWDKKPATPAGVHSAKLAFVFMGQARMLSRSTFKGWATPSFSFEYEEPVSTPAEKSMIRRLDSLFRARPELNYKLVDYGPLEWPPYEKAEAEYAAPVRPWWKFW